MAFLVRLFSRRWTTVWSTRVHRYEQHRDGRRRVTVIGPGWQPIDRGWLAGGDRSSARSRRPPQGSAGVPPKPTPYTPPRYDEVFDRGTRWLDEE